MERERFSLLLLEPGEVYFEDFSVNLLKPLIVDESRRMGRLKLCSKSLVYDPRDVSQPIVKISFKDCTDISSPPGSLQMRETNVLTISCDQHIEMLENNTIAPYKFRAQAMQFLFEFNYVRVDDCLTKISQLYRASSLQACEQNSMIATIVYSRHNRLKFDLLWLEDVYEEVITEFQVDEITPLVVNPGRLLLSSKAIYFQPYNNVHPYLVKKIKLCDITGFLQRRFLLRQVGLDIQWRTSDKDDHLYVSFRRDSDREAFYEATKRQKEFTYTDPEPESMILKWQNGLISNYDYLLYLNSLADRTFQDLTQYPVFPWVISDYKSDHLDLTNPKTFRDLKKPIGALNPERLERLLERFDEMADPKFLYGSHYSTPGFVLFYLVRKYPKLMLCLCYGKFDHPDRMFNKVEEVFNNCLNNMSDFKELIPEFYDTEAKGDFLVNSSKINFGCRADGTVVNHVILPAWAKNSPEIFVKTLREALESEYVSQNLHHWIDLMFGYKQRGEEAVKANNLFYHLCYEGAVDLDGVTDIADRHALEVQISEFGQVPKQLFTRPHVPRVVTNSQSGSLSPSAPKSSDDELLPLLKELSLQVKYSAHKDVITSVVVDGKCIISTGKDGVLKCYDFENQKQLRSVPVTSMPISSCIKLPGVNIVVLGSWDNSIVSYDLDYGRTTNVITAHDDAVSCLAYITSLGLVVSGSWDCSVKIWKGFDKNSLPSFRMSDSMKAYLSLEDKVECLDAKCRDTRISVAIGNDVGEIILWTLDSTIVNKSPDPGESTTQSVILSTKSSITGVAFNGNASKVASCDEAGIFRVIYISDHQMGTVIFQKELTSSFTCLNWTLSETQVLVGDVKGQIHVWDVRIGEMSLECETHSGPVWCITRTPDSKKIITAGCDSPREICIKVWSAIYDKSPLL
ncbi:protein FAN-like [Phlebotomus argentipes]|uniref:protein FAN-like n=1 Tax=Phlebotomus argentipes TaxID=94469 RepID=UPI002892F5B9|nr:protein FAN-like [Phlebotomus argentipes]